MANEAMWDQFAKDDAEFYILTNEDVDFSTIEGQRYFYRSGEEFVAQSMISAKPYLRSCERALEIGPGIGRLTLPHARIFEHVSAVDVSPTMLSRLKANVKEYGRGNLEIFLPHEPWDVPQSYDYAYSFIVFQHIADWSVISDYISRIARSLKPDGLAQLHFDTRPKTFAYRLRNHLPDALLPKTQRQGIRRIRRSPNELRALFAKQGLWIVKETAIGTEHGTFLLVQAAGRSSA